MSDRAPFPVLPALAPQRPWRKLVQLHRRLVVPVCLLEAGRSYRRESQPETPQWPRTGLQPGHQTLLPLRRLPGPLPEAPHTCSPQLPPGVLSSRSASFRPYYCSAPYLLTMSCPSAPPTLCKEMVVCIQKFPLIFHYPLNRPLASCSD